MSGKGKKTFTQKAKAKGRPRKILRDNIGGISRPCYAPTYRSCRSHSNKRRLMYEVIRSHLSELIRIF